MAENSLKKVYSKNVPLLAFEAVFFIFAAVLIFLMPLQVMATLTILFGIILALFGLYQILGGFFAKEKEGSGKVINIFFGIVNLVLGLVFFLQPVGSMIALVYIFAILFLIKALRTFVIALEMSRAKVGPYGLEIAISIFMAALAVLVLFYPALGAKMAMYFIGATLILYALADTHMYVELTKIKKRTSK